MDNSLCRSCYTCKYASPIDVIGCVRCTNTDSREYDSVMLPTDALLDCGSYSEKKCCYNCKCLKVSFNSVDEAVYTCQNAECACSCGSKLKLYELINTCSYCILDEIKNNTSELIDNIQLKDGDNNCYNCVFGMTRDNKSVLCDNQDCTEYAAILDPTTCTLECLQFEPKQKKQDIDHDIKKYLTKEEYVSHLKANVAEAFIKTMKTNDPADCEELRKATNNYAHILQLYSLGGYNDSI